MKIHVGFKPGYGKEGLLINAVKTGIRRIGWRECGMRDCEVAVLWGWRLENRMFFERMRAENKPFIIVDYPFFNRPTKAQTKEGYFKFSLGGINPTNYLDRGGQDMDRYFKMGGQPILSWKKRGDYILVAGMGPKGCAMYGQPHGAWDAQAIEIIKASSGRDIIYRPKPSDKNPPIMRGVIVDDIIKSFDELVRDAWAVVTHHGNSTLEGLRMGVPAFGVEGPAITLGLSDLRQIESPIYPSGREDLFAKLAMWQWSYEEICAGRPLLHLKEKGLI